MLASGTGSLGNPLDQSQYIRYTSHRYDLVVDPRSQRTAPCPGDHAAKVPPMIAVGFGFLALFSILSILLGSEDPRRADPRDDVRLWMRFGIR
jgi:hypothetical protein